MSKKVLCATCMLCFSILLSGMAVFYGLADTIDRADCDNSPVISCIVVQELATGESRTLRPQTDREEILGCLSLQKDAGQDTLYAAYYVSIFYEDVTNVYYTVRKEDAGYEFFQELFTPEYEFVANLFPENN